MHHAEVRLSKSYKYSGNLAQRRGLTPGLLQAAILRNDKSIQSRVEAEEFDRKVRLMLELAADCGQIAEDIHKVNWLLVTAEMARRHVPAFWDLQRDGNGGAPRKMDRADEGAIYREMERRIAGGQKERPAAKEIAKSRKKGESTAAITSRFHRTKNQVTQAQAFADELDRRMRPK